MKRLSYRIITHLFLVMAIILISLVDLMAGGSLAPSHHDFGRVEEENQVSVSLVLTNAGDENLYPIYYSTDGHVKDFYVDWSGCYYGVTLAANQSCSVTVTFAPRKFSDMYGQNEIPMSFQVALTASDWSQTPAKDVTYTAQFEGIGVPHDDGDGDGSGCFIETAANSLGW